MKKTCVLTLLLLGAAAMFAACNSDTSDSSSAPARDIARDSPFGFHSAAVANQAYDNNGYGDASNIGVTWPRDGVYAYWFLVQPVLSDPTYTFTQYDRQWSSVPAGMRILANIAPQGPVDEGRCLANSYFPVDEQKYVAFVKAMVQRYSGDSYASAGLAAPITYWQVGNEPNDLRVSRFADLQRITYTAIKEVCPDCIVLIGGVPGMPPAANYLSIFDQQYKPILDALGGKYVDVMDFHWYGNATGDYRGAKEAYDHIRSVLNADGFPAVPIWITEMGAYSGDPLVSLVSPADYALQTEQQQAQDYFKRFVYSLSFGVKKVFPAFGLMEGFKHDGGYFDYTGLIYDGWDAAGTTPSDLGLGVKKLGYYTYKKMTEMLEGSDWNNIETLRETGDVYIYKFVKNGKAVYAAWWDYFNDSSYTPGKTIAVTLSGLDGTSAIVTEVVPKFSSGAEVTDYSSAFNTSTVAVSGGSATLTLGDSPVLVEAARRTFIMIHLEAGHKACNPLAINLPEGLPASVCSQGWQEYFWPTVIELVEKADEYGFKLTLAFTPQWGEFIANDSTRLDLARQWKTQGHELGFQHHSISHVDWDGYSNGPDAVNDPLYLGPVNDGFSYVNALASPDNIISSTTGSLPVDFPSLMTSPTLIYGEGNADNSYPQLGTVRSLKPVTSRPLIGTIERDLIQLTTRVLSTVMEISPEEALPVLQEQYGALKDDEVFGIVWHEFDYFKAKDAYIQWFDFIKANGNSVKTMSELAGEAFVETLQ